MPKNSGHQADYDNLLHNNPEPSKTKPSINETKKTENEHLEPKKQNESKQNDSSGHEEKSETRVAEKTNKKTESAKFEIPEGILKGFARLEGGDDVKSSCPLCLGLHACYNGRYKVLRDRKIERIT